MVFLYTKLISENLCTDILQYYESQRIYLVPSSGHSNFPARRRLLHFPDELIGELCCQLVSFNVNTEYIRLYEQDYGIIGPHKDVSTDPNYMHTMLIYLTDKFEGSSLSIEMNDCIVTPKPQKCYGIVFPKGVTHYTTECLVGQKIILLLDVEPF